MLRYVLLSVVSHANSDVIATPCETCSVAYENCARASSGAHAKNSDVSREASSTALEDGVIRENNPAYEVPWIIFVRPDRMLDRPLHIIARRCPLGACVS